MFGSNVAPKRRIVFLPEWLCTKCGKLNRSWRVRCEKCGTERPNG